MSVFRYIWCWLSYWSPWCIWNITGREHNHYRSMCDKREIKKEVLHHVSKSPCLSSDRPCCDRHCRMLDFVKTVWCSGTSNSSFLRLSPLVIILKAHFYTGYSPYVRSVRLNAPGTWMSGVFCVTAFRTGGCAPLRRYAAILADRQ